MKDNKSVPRYGHVAMARHLARCKRGKDGNFTVEEKQKEPANGQQTA